MPYFLQICLFRPGDSDVNRGTRIELNLTIGLTYLFSKANAITLIARSIAFLEKKK